MDKVLGNNSLMKKYFKSILHFKNINSIFAVRKIVNIEDKRLNKNGKS